MSSTLSDKLLASTVTVFLGRGFSRYTYSSAESKKNETFHVASVFLINSSG